MVAFNKFNCFQRDLLQGSHDLRAIQHQVKAMLTNTQPLATNSVKADITEITAQFGYPAGGTDIQNDVTLVGGVGQLTGVDVTFTGAGGIFGPFRWVVLYNDTQTSPAKPLIGWYEYHPTTPIQVGDTESFTVDFGATVLTIA